MSDREATEPILGSRFDDAFLYASQVHRLQLRRGTDVPYLAHLLGVASLVLEDGGDEDEAIAGLLHDTVDYQGVPALNEIRRRFGTRVAELVEHCTDHDPAHDKPTWRPRKQAYLDALPQQTASALRVMLADKLFNARELLAEYRQVGEQLWRRYSAGREMLWYLRGLADGFTPLSKSPMVHELQLVVDELERLAATANTTGTPG
jgi:(p)ppGpp synthase/HD superfamily hydrolase